MVSSGGGNLTGIRTRLAAAAVVVVVAVAAIAAAAAPSLSFARGEGYADNKFDFKVRTRAVEKWPAQV